MVYTRTRRTLDHHAVARRVIQDIVDTHLAAAWQDYPEIGLADWRDIMRVVEKKMEFDYCSDDFELFEAAFRRLAAVANDDPS